MRKGALFVGFSLFLLMLGTASCTTDRALPRGRQQLVIASDYLKENDSSLFSSFARARNVDVIIKEMSLGDILDQIESTHPNSGLDVVMLKSLPNVSKLNEKKMLHPLYKSLPQFETDTAFVSFRLNYIGLGLDPFVVRFNSDTIRNIGHYRELRNIEHANALCADDQLSFLGPLTSIYPDQQVSDWIKEWKTHAHPIQLASSPSLEAFDVLLGLHSDVRKLYSSTHLDKLCFPSGIQKGSYFNLRTIAIVRQAENYVNALNFSEYYRNPGHNEILNAALNTIPLDYALLGTNPSFSANAIPLESLIQYRSDIRQLLDSLEANSSTP